MEGLPPGAEVKVEQTSSQFLVGCNMFNFDQLGSDALNAEYRAAFTNLFNAATLAFYWKNMEPREGQFRFESGPRDLPEFWNAFDHEKDDAYKLVEWRRPAPDRLIEFCRANGVAMHGHALIYVAWSPDWLWDVATTPELAARGDAFVVAADGVTAVIANAVAGFWYSWEAADEPTGPFAPVGDPVRARLDGELEMSLAEPIRFRRFYRLRVSTAPGPVRLRR